jgi:hypothetical protein
MALQAEGAHVGQVALSAAFDDWDDVVGVPQVAAGAPVLFELTARLVVELALVFAKGLGVDAARGAHPFVSSENLFAEISRVGAELPLVDARGATKRPAAAGNCDSTPAAGEALRAPDPAARHDAAGAHTRSS